MNYDAYWTGRVSDISISNGNSQKGPWTRTHFKLTRSMNGQNGPYETYWWLDSFANINLVEGGIYLLGIEIKNEKQQDGKTYALKLYANMASPIDVPQGNQPAQTQQTQQAPQNNYRQAPQYQQNNNSYNGGYPPAPQRASVNMNNGPENFKDDDIPF